MHTRYTYQKRDELLLVEERKGRDESIQFSETNAILLIEFRQKKQARTLLKLLFFPNWWAGNGIRQTINISGTTSF